MPSIVNEFTSRHIGPSPRQQAHMLELLGFSSLDALSKAVLPKSIQSDNPMGDITALSETEALAKLKEIAGRNEVFKNYIGQGYYGTYTPPPIQRNILENPAWYTAYTPYQAELSQGRLEALLNFQTLISDLTALPVANASLLDEATAAAEAMTFCRRLSKNKGSNRFFASCHCHPQTLDVLRTRAEPLGIELDISDERELKDTEAYFGALLQYPASLGDIFDYRECIAHFQQSNALVAVSADLLALTLLTPPGELGADVAIGSSQRFGIPLGFGGPYAAFFATREAYKRDIPGRLVGISVDRFGNPALRLAMQTREQHIRREKATSNICTAQVLLANMASMYAVYHGPEGLKAIAQRIHRLTVVLAKGLAELGMIPEQSHYFDTLTVPVGESQALLARAQAAGINLRLVDGQRVALSLDETTSIADVTVLLALFADGKTVQLADPDQVSEQLLPQQLLRQSAYLEHEVFHHYRSETKFMRYMRKLADKDLALDRSMIPLGSCTMKLNAASEMMPISWPELTQIHPFAPKDQSQGYRQLATDLERLLCLASGYDALSLQPNSGAQGEYAGLLAIRGYHRSRGDEQRDICLIPESAHGTNPASAAMAGFKVMVVACDEHGNVDIQDLTQKAEQNSDRLAALMITYPSTHGVFEEGIRQICDVVHANGGQVYIDGANMNAMVGLCAPGHFGGDISHLNLHKTFCIPHGGGGPGVGPVAAKAHLAPFLPGHRQWPEHQQGAVSAAPLGSANILPISWMYLHMMGSQGLRMATQVAILNANYIAKRLNDYYPVLYTGKNQLVAHECILDLRHLKESSGITVDDVAKRLIDYGFHAPTMSFPVAGTLMVEPTESESLEELDRFCVAMIAILEEIRAVEEGRLDKDDNPLKNAPHTAVELASDWPHPYSREQAVFPVDSLKDNKYWSPVGRVDNVYGDRHLVCTCPPMEAYMED